MANLELKNIWKRWGDFVAVKNFQLEIADKEFLVLLGPSGCGKTTTMRMIAGLEDPTQGEIYIGGRMVNDLEPKDRDVSMVFQNYGLYPNLNVYDNICFPLKVRKVHNAEQDQRVRKAAGMVELLDLLDRRPAELSGGQRQRVALARAIVREPNVFLMDEPLSNLDAKLRISTRAQIKNLQYELQVTTVYVTHDQTEAMTLADRVVVMNHGEIQQVGSPLEIYDRPQNTFVAGFIGRENRRRFVCLLKEFRFQIIGPRRLDNTWFSCRGCRNRIGRWSIEGTSLRNGTARRCNADHFANRRQLGMCQDAERFSSHDGTGTGGLFKTSCLPSF